MAMLGDFLPKTTSEMFSASTLESDKTLNDASSAYANISKTSPTNFLNSASNFDIATNSQKIGEGAQKMATSFGGFDSFKNIGGGLSTDSMKSQLTSAGLGNLTQQNQSAKGNTPSGSARENIDAIIVTLQSTVSNDVIKLSVSPRISESRQASYSEQNITHHPGAILKYDKTNSRVWQIGAKLVSRTPEEASQNQLYLNIIRSWVMPYYGTGTAADAPALLGAPPPILKMSGYGVKNISPIPVVLESYSTNWPNDVDYIPTLEGDPFPVIMEIDLALKESYSPAEYSKFNLFAYKSGNLANAFSGAKFETAGSAVATPNGKTNSAPSVISTADPIKFSKQSIPTYGVASAKSLMGTGSLINSFDDPGFGIIP